MSNFTYEIDERNLRIQLKEFVIPVKEDAWQKFETFSDSMVSHHRENRLKNFNFTMNRNVILPSVFGVIIILFSFLLVNFVSIKNPVKDNGQKAETATKMITAAAGEPAPKIEKPAPAVITESKPEVLPVVTPTVAEVKTEEVKAVTAAPKSDPEPVQTINTTETPAETIVTSTSNEEVKAKRKARRRAEAVESQKLSDIRPTPVSEERDSEIRPD